jgi:hypothetical protein
VARPLQGYAARRGQFTRIEITFCNLASSHACSGPDVSVRRKQALFTRRQSVSTEESVLRIRECLAHVGYDGDLDKHPTYESSADRGSNWPGLREAGRVDLVEALKVAEVGEMSEA